jgi:hypothetical protein
VTSLRLCHNSEFIFVVCKAEKFPSAVLSSFALKQKKIYFALSNRACANLDLDSQRKYFSRQKNVSVTGAAKHRWKFCFSTGQ